VRHGATSVGSRPGTRIATAIGCLAAIGFGVYFFATTNLAGPAEEHRIVIDGRGEEFPGTPAGTDLVSAGVGDLLRLTGLCMLAFVLLGGYLLLRTLRYSAWLDGTRGYVRGALLTRSADLSRAQVAATVTGGGVPQVGYRMPAIDARDRATGSGSGFRCVVRSRAATPGRAVRTRRRDHDRTYRDGSRRADRCATARDGRRSVRRVS
jgi:hypothetical protein